CLALDDPQSVERGIVKCLYNLAKHLKTKPSVISGEKKHLSSVFFAAAYNIKAYGPFSSLTQRLGLTKCDLKTP
ncbi:hypothetical protein pdam_00002345, partial [Pocillopora damicornis]